MSNLCQASDAFGICISFVYLTDLTWFASGPSPASGGFATQSWFIIPALFVMHQFDFAHVSLLCVQLT